MKKIQDEALEDWNKYGSNFPEKTKDLIKVLLSKLRLTNDELNEDLLYKLDQKVFNDASIEKDFYKKYFMHLIAAIGELLIIKNEAEWLMKLGIDGLRWKPYLNLKNGKTKINEINFVTYIHGEVFIKNSQKKDFLVDIYERENWIISLKR